MKACPRCNSERVFGGRCLDCGVVVDNRPRNAATGTYAPPLEGVEPGRGPRHAITDPNLDFKPDHILPFELPPELRKLQATPIDRRRHAETIGSMVMALRRPAQERTSGPPRDVAPPRRRSRPTPAEQQPLVVRWRNRAVTRPTIAAVAEVQAIKRHADTIPDTAASSAITVPPEAGLKVADVLAAAAMAEEADDPRPGGKPKRTITSPGAGVPARRRGHNHGDAEPLPWDGPTEVSPISPEDLVAAVTGADQDGTPPPASPMLSALVGNRSTPTPQKRRRSTGTDLGLPSLRNLPANRSEGTSGGMAERRRKRLSRRIRRIDPLTPTRLAPVPDAPSPPKKRPTPPGHRPAATTEPPPPRETAPDDLEVLLGPPPDKSRGQAKPAAPAEVRRPAAPTGPPPSLRAATPPPRPVVGRAPGDSASADGAPLADAPPKARQDALTTAPPAAPDAVSVLETHDPAVIFGALEDGQLDGEGEAAPRASSPPPRRPRPVTTSGVAPGRPVDIIPPRSRRTHSTPAARPTYEVTTTTPRSRWDRLIFVALGLFVIAGLLLFDQQSARQRLDRFEVTTEQVLSVESYRDSMSPDTILDHLQGICGQRDVSCSEASAWVTQIVDDERVEREHQKIGATSDQADTLVEYGFTVTVRATGWVLAEATRTVRRSAIGRAEADRIAYGVAPE